ncbi:hypothetical protein ABZ746_17560 [Streptomyces sp. NPDC020096]
MTAFVTLYGVQALLPALSTDLHLSPAASSLAIPVSTAAMAVAVLQGLALGGPHGRRCGRPGTRCRTMTVRACHADDFTPRVRHQADVFATVLAPRTAGQGVALVPQLGVVGPPDAVLLTGCRSAGTPGSPSAAEPAGTQPSPSPPGRCVRRSHANCARTSDGTVAWHSGPGGAN